MAFIAPSRQVSTPALGLRMNEFRENPSKNKKLFAVGADEPSSSKSATGLNEGVVSDMVREECGWEKKGNSVGVYSGTVCLFQ